MAEPTGDKPPAAAARPKIQVEVVWDDITRVSGDVHVVGHYRGVLPQNAELVLDRAVSGLEVGADGHHILTDFTRRGVIRGALGDLLFVPWGRSQIALVAGMGVPGSFRPPELRKLIAGVASAVGHLISRPTLTTVLIGGGPGNLTVPLCVAGLVDGLRDAFEMDPGLLIRTVRIVEVQLDRALEIQDALEEYAGPGARGVDLEPAAAIVEGPGGMVPRRFRYSMLLAALAKSGGLPEHSDMRVIRDALVEGLQRHGGDRAPGEIEVQALFEDLKKESDGNPALRQLALRRFPIGPPPRDDRNSIATRLVFAFEGTHVRSSAITDTVTVREREVAVSSGLLQEAATRLTRADDFDDPQPEQVARLGRYVFTLLVHPDLEEQFTKPTEARVIELDQPLAAIPWEMLIPPGVNALPVGIAAPVSRQLRTQYSPRPEDAGERRIRRALIIANPADGPAGELDCKPEARLVRKLLSAAGIETTIRIGPKAANSPLEPGEQSAGFFDTLVQLLQDEFDLVHFCGHATFVPDQPDLIGWVFADHEILAARYLQQMRRPPLLVFANACNSAQLTGVVAAKAGAVATADPGAAAAAGLADEFFRQGIRDYVGTASEVPSNSATKFAAEFYTALLASKPIGEAVRAAREALYRDAGTEGAVWGAYQHYGDPTRVAR